jgi:hypothetical protein
MTLFLRKETKDEFIDDPDDNGSPIVSFSKMRHHQSSKIESTIEPLDEDEIEMLKEIRIKQVKFNRIMKELTLNIMTIVLLLYICYSSFDINKGYKYQYSLKNSFQPKNITKVEDLWNWTIDNFLSLLDIQSSILIGNPIIRQLRVKKDSCPINSLFMNITQECEADLAILNRDTNNYSLSWTDDNSSFLLMNSFEHTSADTLNSYLYSGIYNTYPGDGYIYELNSSSNCSADLKLLKQMNWINRETRAIFINFITSASLSALIFLRHTRPTEFFIPLVLKK